MEPDAATAAIVMTAGLFNEIAEDYDQSGVPFFGPIAQRLVDLVDPREGEDALDIGCGRGAVALRLAPATGLRGQVTAIDVAEKMADATQRAADEAGLSQVSTRVMDASRPVLPAASYDLVTASAVLFFLPDPEAALRHWLALLRPTGRIGITTFGPTDEIWQAIDDLFVPFLPPQMLDARTSGKAGPFASAAGVDALFERCGATSIETRTETLPVVFEDPEVWQRWSMGTGMRRMWRLVPDGQSDAVHARVEALLERARTSQGTIALSQQVRYTTAGVGAAR